MYERVAFITGCNKGLGLHLAIQLARDHKFTVYAACRKSSAELDALQASQPHNVFIIDNMDVTKEENVKSAYDIVKKKTETVDLLINNAAIYDRGDSVFDVNIENMMASFLTNAVGPLLVSRTFLPLVKNSPEKQVVVVGTRAASLEDNSSGGVYAYRASKAAGHMIAKNMSIEFAKEGVTTVVVHPGMVATDMLRSNIGSMSLPQGTVSEEEGARRLLDNVILKLTHSDNGKFFSWNGQIIPW